MPKFVRSAKGELLDFNLMALKSQLAAAPVPQVVSQRKAAIVEKDTGRSAADTADFLSIATAAAEESASTLEKE